MSQGWASVAAGRASSPAASDRLPAAHAMPSTPDPVEPRSRPWVWTVYLLLFAASVPWYLPAGGPVRLWFGLPHWVVLSLAAYLAVAVFTVYVVARHWPAPPVDGDPNDAEGAS